MAHRSRKRVANRRPSKSRASQPLDSNFTLSILSSARSLHNLPTQVTSFIGREREIAEIQRELQHTRLMTLTGAGGCGKSRLALQIAPCVVDAYADGVWFVELAPLSDALLVPKAVASTLGIPENLGLPLTETLERHFKAKELLLILDNCEHVLSACAQLANALLRACPNLRILATSREGLGIAGELSYIVPGLSLPDSRHLPDCESLRQFEAVRLFVDRASFSQPGFVLTEINGPAVAQVCSSLDGIPLAIELAAARIKGLSVEQIASRLDDRFRLLLDGSRTALPRHQTLRATVDWSHSLLSEPEQVLFRRVSVFAGGFTLEAVEGICGGDTVPAPEILNLLLRLVGKSLVIASGRGAQTRYRLLETMRQYAWQKFMDAGESDEVRRRHLVWYLGLAEQSASKVRGPEQQVWLDRLEDEHDNLRTALEWSQTDPAHAENGLRLATALYTFWVFHGHFSEGRRWLEATLPPVGKIPSQVRAKAIPYVALMALWQGDYGPATDLARQGLTAARKMGDKDALVGCRRVLGHVALHRGDYGEASKLFQDAIDLSRKLNDTWLLGITLGDLQFVARDQGDYEQAAALGSESLALFRKMGDKHYTAWALRNLGLVALRRGDHKQTSRFCRDGLTLSRETGNIWIVEQCLMGLAGATTMEGQYKQAAMLFAAAETLRTSLGRRRSRADQADYEKRVASTRAKLGETAFTDAWTQGTRMTLEEAVGAALAPSEILPAAGPEKVGSRHASLFTPRECEVVALVAQGLSNREIASRLVISERTADTHVQHILNKLGVGSRVQVTAWAVEHGLHTHSFH